MHTVELPQSDDLQGELTLDWQRRTTTLSWRLVPLDSPADSYYLVFREKERDAEWDLYIASEYEARGPMMGVVRCVYSEDKSEKTTYFASRELEQVLATHVLGGHYGGWVRLTAEELGHPWARWLFLNATGSGCWSKHGEELAAKNEDIVPFEKAGLTTLGTLESLSLDEIRATVLNELAKPESQVRFALDWLELSSIQRMEAIYPLAKGEWEQLRHVLTCVLRWEIARQKGNAESVQWHWSIPLTSGGVEYLQRGDEWFSNARLRRWKKIVMEYFAPQYNADLARLHDCIIQWQRYDTAAINVSLKSPSQHEVLEAHLFLLEWAQGKIEPKLIKLLLPSPALQS